MSFGIVRTLNPYETEWSFWTYGISFLVLALLLRLNGIYVQLVLSERIVFLSVLLCCNVYLYNDVVLDLYLGMSNLNLNYL